MKNKIKKWSIRISALGLVLSGLLTCIVLDPILTYAGKTTYQNYTIIHQKTYDEALIKHIDQATELVQKSEWYSPDLHINICLNDGSEYPKLIKAIRGHAFAWGFYHDVVFEGSADYKNNMVEINGYKWNFTQLLAHEMMHCFQFHKLGLFKSNPVANIPNWKWEGYPEYIARQNSDQKDLIRNIDRLIKTEKTDNNNWVTFSDGTGTVLPYYNNWILVQYCMDIKKMNYVKLLKDTTSEENVRKQMMDWYLKAR